eukprot:TRINITY_DN25760_c0_g3_i1.p3 TRINITY_DN25760_c0_g3~~TRINITY_DN25760_c0_g3_i1.p3  ORF type:complete len:114 (+),score=32.33 TRINITY_DN25760_c0_g3_i1:92-433(+)
MQCKALFDKIREQLPTKGKELVKKGGGCSFQFIITDAGPEGKFCLNLRDGCGSAEWDEVSRPDITLKIKDSDLMAISTGKLDSTEALMSGKLKLKGSHSLAMKLEDVLMLVQQ